MKRFICLFTLFISIISNAQTAQVKVIIPMRYDDLLEFSEGFAWACKGGSWGVINMENEVIIPFKYEWPGRECKNDRIIIPSEYACYDVQGNRVFSYEGYDAFSYSEGLAVILIDEKNYKVVDVSGKERFKGQNQCPGDGFHDGMLLFSDPDSELFGYVNVNGEVAIPAQYSFALPFSEGMGAVVDKDDNYGFINKTGAIVIPCSYDMATSFNEGYAWCELNGTGNFIDKYGKIKIKDRIESKFEGGLAIVTPSSSDPSSYQNYEALIIDKDGVAIFGTTSFDQTKRFGKNYFLISSLDTWSVINNDGEYITKEISNSAALPYQVCENNTIIVQDPETGKYGAVQLLDNSYRNRRPGESYAQWVERLHSLGEGLK